MKFKKLVFASIVILIAFFAQCENTGTPDEEVKSFLSVYHSLKFTGLPNPEQMKRLSPFLSPNLQELIRRASKAQEEFIAKYPEEKPPLIEGDLFSSLFEGPTSFEITKTEIKTSRANVLVKFIYVDSRPRFGSTTWNDRYILVKDDSRWLIDDVEYLGNWDFAQKGRLTDVLRQDVTDNK